MFTWEEAGLLRQMLYVMMWIGIVVVVGALAWWIGAR